MRVGFFGDHIWAQKSLEALLELEETEIVFVCSRFKARDQKLEQIAKDNGIPILIIEKISREESFNEIQSYQPDLLISVSYDQIIRRNIIDLPSKGFINCHAGKLPDYRGRNILNWALINDEKEFGITVHYIDEGVDTGDIILQSTYSIEDADTYKTLIERCFEEIPELVKSAVIQIQNDTVKRQVQADIGEGFTCKRRGPGDEIINWDQSSREVFNFIRAITEPAIGARSSVDNKEFTILQSEIIESDIEGNIGEIEVIDQDHIKVQCGRGSLKLFLKGHQLSGGECFK